MRHCPICDAKNCNLFIEIDNFPILKCNSCNIVYLNKNISNDSIGELYTTEYFEGGPEGRGYECYQNCEKFLTLNFRRRIKELSQYVNRGNVLDVGCGYGFFLKCLDKRYKGFGIDISEHAIHIARENYNLNVRLGSIDWNTFPPNTFSLITMWDVIEHLPDPKLSLEILHSMLREDGMIAITTGNVKSYFAKICGKRWHLYSVPEHLWYFSPQSLTMLLEKTGFRIFNMRHEMCFYSLDYLVERLLKTIFKKDLPLFRAPFKSILGSFVIPFTLFDIMYVICKRKV